MAKKGGAPWPSEQARRVLTIVRLDTLEILLPAQVLAVDVSHVGDEKSILVAGLARVFIDVLHALLQGVANHLLGNGLSILMEVWLG